MEDRWEYKVTDVQCLADGPVLWFLGELGKQGWEAFAVEQPVACTTRVWLKRRIACPRQEITMGSFATALLPKAVLSSPQGGTR